MTEAQTKKARKPRKRKDDHVTMGGKGLRCQHCGTEQELPYHAGGTSFMEEDDGGGGFKESWRPAHGISIKVMEVYSKEFTARHLGCKADDPRGKARYTYANPQEWIKSWDTGTSALAIYAVMMGKKLGQVLGGHVPRDPVPHDPADFGRCYRLLQVALDWRANLDRMAEEYPCWAPYVAAWDELERLYEEELPSGECPKLYEAMKAL